LSVDDKYLDNGMVKIMTTLCHILRRLAVANPKRINELYTIGFLIMGK
jgi:hypothetical protein